MTFAGRRLVVMMDTTRNSCTVATNTWKVIVPGRIEVKLFLHHSALQMMIIHLLTMEFSNKPCHPVLFHLRSSFPSTVTVYGGGSRI